MNKYKVKFKLRCGDHSREVICSGTLSKEEIVEYLGLDNGYCGMV